MRVWITGLLVVLAAATAHAADPLAEARRLYNLGQYNNAARFASEAIKVPAMAEGARLILGRIYLEQYRQSADADHLMQAREALRAVNPQSLERRERVELSIGYGEAMFLDDRFGPAAEAFERALDSSSELGESAHERLLDWWASAIDRLALTGPRDTRELVYERIVARMERSWPGIRLPRRPSIGLRRRRVVRAISSVPGTPPRPAGSPRRSARTTARHCAPTSIG